jgi:hypothetical protein
MDYDPGVQVLGKGLIQFEFLGPFTIVPLIGHIDAGFCYIQLIQRLDGLQFNIPGARKPSANNILRKLCMRTGGHTERGLHDLSVTFHPEHIVPMGRKKQVFMDPEDLTGLFLFNDPFQELVDPAT